MGKISDITREQELIGLFLSSRDAMEIAIEENFTADECVDEFNNKVLHYILEESRFQEEFIPSIHFVLDKLELKDKDRKEIQLKLNRYKKMVDREIINNAQYKDMTKRNIYKLRDLYTKRKVIKVLRDGLDSIDVPAREFISNIQKGLNNVELNDGMIVEVSIHTGFTELKKEMEYQVEHDIEFGFKFGLRDFDKMAQDQVARGTLTYIVGRPSNYKTGTALNLGQNAAEIHGIPTAILSCEMKPADIYRRILSRITGIAMSRLKNPKELSESEWTLLDKAIQKVEKWPLYVVDASRLNIGQYDSIVSYLKSKYGVELLFQDYFQLIRTRKGNIPHEEWEFGAISEELRMIALNHNVGFVALSQANRGCEQRDDKRPTMKDIRSTGKAEQDAHNIFYVYRDEFYFGSQSEVPNHMEIGALKIREGELRKALFHFNGAKATIGNVDPMMVMDKPRDYIGGGGLAE
jgi:replicative DNA helicase